MRGYLRDVALEWRDEKDSKNYYRFFFRLIASSRRWREEGFAAFGALGGRPRKPTEYSHSKASAICRRF